MKLCSLIFSLFAICAAALFVSCSDDNGTSFPPVYDLRRLWATSEEYTQPTAEKTVPTVFEGNTVPAPFRPDFGPERAILGAVPSNNASVLNFRVLYEYGANAHLYYTSITFEDGDGNILQTGTQTLDDRGFPVRLMYYDGQGTFVRAYDYTFDENLYQETSEVRYAAGEDPTDNPDARKIYERYNAWNQDGIGTYQSFVSYDSDGDILSEYKFRSITVKNCLRGNLGIGAYEYYRIYDEGVLTYEKKCTFDGDGYTESCKVDENGDGHYEITQHTEIEKTPEGYPDSIVWVRDDTEEKYLKESFDYNDEGLLKRFRVYDVESGEFVLSSIVTSVWYKNPVNGPTGGIEVHFESDEQGNPVGEYQTVDWTVDWRLMHYYSAPGEESVRDTFALEKIRLQ